jgi:DNA polymerase-3 subunit epsilon/CBS domain-containing protein
MCDILDRIGIPLCKGGVMASQPAYRGSVATWRDRISHWLSRSNPEDLLSVDIVFDLRPVHGDIALATDLRQSAWAAARPQKAFLKLLAANGEGAENPFGFLGGWKTGPDGRVDLKNAGLRSLVSGARVLAISEGHVVYATHDRLAALAAAGTGATRDIEDLDRTHACVLDAILRQQLRDLTLGLPLTNRVAPDTFDRLQTRRMKAALGHLSIISTLVKDRLVP